MSGLKFWERWTKKPQDSHLLDGTPATFLKQLKRYSEVEYSRLVIMKSTKPNTAPCVICDEPGGEYTIHGTAVDYDDDGPYELDVCWAIHQDHFESSLDEHGSTKEISKHGDKSRRARG